jgi:dCMP deaminase
VQQKWIDAYLDMAERFAQLSYAKRLQVGAIVVKEHRVISIGYNGTPEGWDNACEFQYTNPQSKITTTHTKDEVIHAEANAITKLARDGQSGRAADLFCTHAPCIQCAKLIHGAGIKKVYYRHQYRDDAGIKFLTKGGVEVVQSA